MEEEEKPKACELNNTFSDTFSENSESTEVSQEFTETSRRGSLVSQDSFDAIISNIAEKESNLATTESAYYFDMVSQLV